MQSANFFLKMIAPKKAQRENAISTSGLVVNTMRETHWSSTIEHIDSRRSSTADSVAVRLWSRFVIVLVWIASGIVGIWILFSSWTRQ